jgi:hypothetical protein
MVDEFEFFRKARAYNYNVPFLVQFTYRLSHRVDKPACAQGAFSCHVNPHKKMVEYVLSLKSDPISRPFSEQSNFLFSSQYEELPPQFIAFDDYLIQALRYPLPIAYDWQAFIMSGAEKSINVKSVQQLFKEWKLKGVNGQEVDAKLKAEKVLLQWQHKFT